MAALLQSSGGRGEDGLNASGAGHVRFQVAAPLAVALPALDELAGR